MGIACRPQIVEICRERRSDASLSADQPTSAQ
jgi:hypothetical protein